MLQYSISMTSYMSRHNGPEFLICTPRRRSGADKVWDYVAMDDVAAVHEMFKSGQASIRDIEEQCSHTLLHASLHLAGSVMIHEIETNR
jgi:hypothetical protein